MLFVRPRNKSTRVRRSSPKKPLRVKADLEIRRLEGSLVRELYGVVQVIQSGGKIHSWDRRRKPAQYWSELRQERRI
jgi:hypothetical protein